MDERRKITIKTTIRRTCSSRIGHSASLDRRNKSNNRLSRPLTILLFFIVNLCIIVNSEQLSKRKSIDLKQQTIKPRHHKLMQNQTTLSHNNDSVRTNHASIVRSSFTPPYSTKQNSSSSVVDRNIMLNSLTLPNPSSLQQKSSQNDCPVLTSSSNQSPSISNSTIQQMCTCYEFEDGIYIECDHTVPVHIIKLTLSLLKGRLVKSFTIVNLNDTLNNLLSDFSSQISDQQLIAIERFQISYSTMSSLNEILFRGTKSSSLKQLSITSGQLRTIPQNSLKQLKSLETLDLDGNQIDQLDSYAFYGLPLTVLSLQSNKLNTLLEYSFGGLEHTLEELILMHNSLTTFPLVALRRLRKLKTLKLAGNLINELMDDGFTRFTALQNLDLSNNRLIALNDRSLITMPKLVTLSLASNRLASLSESSFIYLLELETLDLSHNAIRTISDKTFFNLGNLRTLDLSSNHLHSLPPHLLHPLHNLRELYLTKNNLLRLSNQTFQNNSQMQALFISHNSLSEIQFGTFSYLTSMQQLHLSFNSLRDLQNLFKYNSALRTLALDNNLIANLQGGCFQELVELRDLRLQRNLLKRVERGVFYSFPSLQELDLEYNRIEQLEPQALQSLVNLQYLNLQGNRLIEVGDSLLSSFPSSLKHVQLNHNQITNIHKGGLKGQTQLEVIWINYNKLQKLSTGVFNDLHNCEKLYLQYNELVTIEPGVFQNMGQLVYLNLEHNNLAQLNIDLFKGANQLIELHLANNHIMDIEQYAFSSLPSLHSLSLDNNQIYVLRKNVFDRNDLKSKDNLPIERLSLSNVMIEELETDTFNSLKQLKSLDISENNLNLVHLNLTNLNSLIELNLKGNNMTLPIEELCTAKQLEQLDVSNTRLTIKQLNKIFACLPNLKKLILNENEIGQSEIVDHMNQTELRDFKILEQLHLERNQLFAIPALSTMRFFPNLKQLSLAGNSIKQVFKSELQFNKELKTLNLSSNGLSVLDAQCFEDLALLTVLDLSNNVMRSLPSNIFIGLNNLEELLLSGNWFQHIPNNLFATGLPNLRTLSFNHNPLQRVREDLSVIGGFPQLINLNLANCSLSIIASHDFFGLPSLMTLNLKNNHITKISPGSFRPLEKLNTLDLQNNELEILPEERLSGLNELISLNLTGNHLVEMPVFSRDLKKLKNLDISHNKLTRVDTFGNLASSLENLNLRGNMITWIDNSAFTMNLTSLRVLDLSRNHLTHFSELIFSTIEVTLERFSLSGNPIHCDCRLLSLWEWLQEHSRLIADENELHCVQPEKLADLPVLSVHPIDFCPVPMITAFEIEQIEHNQVTIRWEVQRNGTELVGGFTLDYHHTEDRFPLAINRQLSATDRSIDIMNLNSTTLYTICVQANGKYLRAAFTNKPTAYVFDHQRTHFNDFVTSNRKCIQVRTLDYSKRTPIQISTFSLIVIAGTISGVFLMCIIVCLLGIKYRRRRTCDSSQEQPEEINKISNELPEEFTITYRHFSLPSTENVYS